MEKFIQNIRETILRWQADNAAAEARAEAEARQQRIEKMRAHFYVDEVDGHLYILCKGVAIELLDNDVSVAEALDSLENARMVALKYEGLA